MNAADLDMRSFLERAGFRIRGTRADCAHCSGRSRLTVSFTSEVAFCHRCNWSANRVILARALGLLSNASEAREAFRREREYRELREVPIRAFEQWRDAELWRVTDEYRLLSRQTFLADQVLKNYPDCESAWEALSTFYHRQAALTAELDRLSCAKTSDFLETPYNIVRLFSEWRATAHAA